MTYLCEGGWVGAGMRAEGSFENNWYTFSNYSACNLQMNTNTSHEATPLSNSTSQGIYFGESVPIVFE